MVRRSAVTAAMAAAFMVVAGLGAGVSLAGCSGDRALTGGSTQRGGSGGTVTTTVDTTTIDSPAGGSSAAGGAYPGTPGAIRVQEDNAYLAYTGMWTQSVSPEDADGDFYFANHDASMTMRFSGTGVAYIAKKAYIYGMARITLDDRAPAMVDLYHPVPQYQQRVWDSGALPSGEHTLKLEWTGEQRPGGRGTYVNLDALEITGTLLFAGPPSRTEQDDPRLLYTGDWSSAVDSSASGDSLKVSASPGASVTFAFKGPYFAWVAKTGPEFGKAKVTVYGRPETKLPDPLVVDLYSPTPGSKKIALEASFESSPTSVTIEAIGTRSPKATGTGIAVDAVDVVGTLLHVPLRYEETRGKYYAFEDTFSWNVYSPAYNASGLKYCYTNLPGATATIRFDGRYLAWIARKAPVYGIARVSVDDGPPEEVNLYSPVVKWKQKVWDTGMLVPGSHTVLIECTGEKAAAATKAFINIDGFDVVGGLIGYR
jgi:hypothetical protein